VDIININIIVVVVVISEIIPGKSNQIDQKENCQN